MNHEAPEREQPQGVKLDPLMGQRYHHLIVVARAADSRQGSKRYFMRCDCGTERLVYERQIIGKQAFKSCGCRGNDVKSAKWTDEEIAILRREYPLLASRCAPLVGHTAIQCRRKAGESGISFIGVHHRKGWWTGEEDAIIHKNYPHGGTATCLPLLPTRSKASIRDRAYHLRVACPRDTIPGTWSSEECEIVRKHYRNGGWKSVAKYLPHRSGDSILNVANQLGVHVKKSWSRAEDREFKKLYLEGGAALCKKRWPERSIVSIRGKARTMRIKYSKFWWNPGEVEIVRKHFPDGGWRAVHALLPHRSEGSIHAYCTKYQIKIRRWTKEEDAILLHQYPIKGASGCQALLPKQTMGSIRHRVNILGLSWNGTWTKVETETLVRLYPEGGTAAVTAVLPHRSGESIRSRAYYIGLRLSETAYADSQKKRLVA